MKSILMRILPHAVAVILFLVIATLFFDMVGEEYGLKQPDFEKVMGMAKESSDFRIVNNEEALWANNMFGGMPTYQTNMVYPSNLLRKVDSLIKLYTAPPIGSLYMCMLGMYILMLCLRVNPWLGIVAAVAFGLSTINILYIGGGHITKVNAIGYMAPALGGFILAFRNRWLLGGAIFMLFFGLHLASNHLQMTYYLAFLIIAVAIGESVRLLLSKKMKELLLGASAALIAGVLALMPNLGNMLTTYEYSKFTTRGKSDLTIVPVGKENVAQAGDGLNVNYILEYNMAPGEPWAMVIPNAKGGSSAVSITENKEAMQKAPKNLRENMQGFPQYWGDQGSSAGAFYFGAGIMFLFALALIFVKDSLKWPFLVMTILAVFLSMKDMHALNNFFIHHFPMYNKFRDSKMILVLIQLMAPALGILYIDQLLRDGVEASRKKLLFGGIGVLVLLTIVVSTAPSITGPLISANEVEYFDQMRDQYKGDSKTVSLIGDLEDALAAVRTEVYKQDAQRSLVIILVMAGLAAVTVWGRMKWYIFSGIALLVVIADMWSVDRRYMNSEKRKNPQTGKLEYAHYDKEENRFFPYTPDRCDEFILNAEKGNAPKFEEHLAILEKAAIERKEYRSFEKEKMKPAAEFGALNLGTNFRVLLANRGTFSESGTAYFHKSIGGYHAAKLKRYQEMIDFYIAAEIDSITGSFKSQNIAIVDSVVRSCKVLAMLNTKYVKYSGEAPPIVNKAALGNAWFVGDLKIAENADDEMSSIATINPADVAVVGKEFESAVKGGISVDSTYSITMTEYGTKRISYSSDTPAEAPAIFSEIWYPAGWVCRIDGQEVNAFRANYFLRGVMVPAGKHTIEWSFEPDSYNTAVTINWIGSVLVLMFAAVVFAVSIKSELTTEKPGVA
jgi:hypothetical protein